MCHQDTIKGLAIHTLQCATKKNYQLCFMKKKKVNGHRGNNRQRAAEIRHF